MVLFKKIISFLVAVFSPAADIRKNQFLIFALTGIPLMLTFGLVSFFVSQDYWQTAFIVPILLSLIISLFRLGRTSHLLRLFRVNTFLFGSLLLFMLTTGGEDGSKIHWMYVYPLSIYFILGKEESQYWNATILLSALIVFIDPLNLPFVYPYTGVTAMRFLISYLSVSLVTHWFEYYREKYKTRLIKQTEELQRALAAVKTLSGYLPVCASCKKVRDDDGAWIDLEIYVESHSEAEISHGLCEECAHNLYPTLIDEAGRGR